MSVLKFPTKLPPKESELRYFCTQCNADTFRILPGGSVHCAKCDALIRNLFVTGGN